MAVTVTTVAQTQRLTRKEAVKAELGISVATDDGLFDDLIDRATSAILSYTNRYFGFGRQVYLETVKGYGNLELALGVGPIVSVASVTYDSVNVITDYTIEDRDQAYLYREYGWEWTMQARAGLVGGQRWPGWGDPQPRSEQPDYAIAYTAGYILPPQHRLSVATLSADAADNSFNDSAGLFPSQLQAGDAVEAYGFTSAANNARWTVSGTPTASKIVVTGTLATEIAAAGKSLYFRGRPDHRPFDDVEKAAIETVKTWYLMRKDDSYVIEKHAGPMGLRRSEQREGVDSLPPLAAALLKRWCWRPNA